MVYYQLARRATPRPPTRRGAGAPARGEIAGDLASSGEITGGQASSDRARLERGRGAGEIGRDRAPRPQSWGPP